MALESIDQVEVVDDQTLVVTTSRPAALTETILAFQVFGAYSQVTAEEHATADDPWADAWFNTNSNSSGPYSITDWQAGTQYVFEPNPNYWRGADWWGVGPGAHSHVAGVRWWNLRHPAAYAERIAAGLSPAHGRERLDAGTRRTERVLLELRLREGLRLDVLDDQGREAVGRQVDQGLATLEDDRLVLTLRGRLLADAVVRDLLP